MDNMNILAIGAHPDDIEIGCGGTLIKYTDRGHKVFFLVVTGGGQGGKPAYDIMSKSWRVKLWASKKSTGVSIKIPTL